MELHVIRYDLELDPEHFYEVQQEPVHHEHEYFSEHANRYAPHAKHQDDYFMDHRHHLSGREEMRALELDPHHFHKVTQDPHHTEHKYFSEHDLQDRFGSSEGEYFEDIIGYQHGGLDFTDSGS